MRKDALLTVAGLVIMAVGLVSAKGYPTLPEALAFGLVGLGAVVFGQGMGNLVTRRALAGDPAARRRHDVEARDERNLEIAHRAKAAAYDCMVFVFGALLIAFALMGVDWTPLLLLAGAYLFVIGYGGYERTRIGRLM